MMYISGYLRIIFLQYNTMQFKSLGSVKFLFFLKKCLMLTKAVAYLFDKKNYIVKYYCNLK